VASVVDICNRALSKLGQIRITSLSDNNKAAKACNHAYPYVRDYVLRTHPWNCTMARATLAPLSTAPTHTFAYAYQLPSDCLKLHHVETPLQWFVEGRTIATDEGATLEIVYQKREEDPNQYDVSLVETMAARLAYELCEEMTQSNSKKDAALREYQMCLQDARVRDAQEQGRTDLEEDDWVNARY